MCAGASATLTATASSAYAWSTGATTQSITVSTAGTYGVTVTNSLGCLGSTSATVSNSPAPASSLTVVQPTTCISTNGSIDLTITTPGAYSWSWSNGATTEDWTGVPVGDYVVTVTDHYTCTHILMQSLIGPGGCSVCPTMPAVMTFAPTSVCANANFTMTVNGMANLGVTYGVTFKRYNTAVVDPYTSCWWNCTNYPHVVDSVLGIERRLSASYPEDRKYVFEHRGRGAMRMYSREFTEAYEAAMLGMVDQRMNASILTLGNIWYSAWVVAGQPDLERFEQKEVSDSLKAVLKAEQELYEQNQKGYGRITNDPRRLTSPKWAVSGIVRLD